MYKKGDKVRCLSDNSCYGLLKNNIYTVERISKNNEIISVENMLNDSNDGSFSKESFELVKDDNMSELKQLVSDVNKGIESFYKITKDENLARQVFYSVTKTSIFKEKNRLDLDVNSNLYIVKQQFPEFSVGPNNWVVKLTDNKVLHIGCKTFNVKDFYNSIKSYVDDKYNKINIITTGLSTKRNGILFTFSEGAHHTLLWEDADKIIKALEDFGIK